MSIERNIPYSFLVKSVTPTGRTCTCGNMVIQSRAVYCSDDCKRTAKKVRYQERYRIAKLMAAMRLAIRLSEKGKVETAIAHLKTSVNEIQKELSCRNIYK